MWKASRSVSSCLSLSSPTISCTHSGWLSAASRPSPTALFAAFRSSRFCTHIKRLRLTVQPIQEILHRPPLPGLLGASRTVDDLADVLSRCGRQNRCPEVPYSPCVQVAAGDSVPGLTLAAGPLVIDAGASEPMLFPPDDGECFAIFRSPFLSSAHQCANPSLDYGGQKSPRRDHRGAVGVGGWRGG
jgi:hypothetical protein